MQTHNFPIGLLSEIKHRRGVLQITAIVVFSRNLNYISSRLVLNAYYITDLRRRIIYTQTVHAIYIYTLRTPIRIDLRRPQDTD